MTDAFEAVNKILKEQGEDLTDEAVEEIKFLSTFFNYTESTEYLPDIESTIGLIKDRVPLKLDGRT